MSYVIRLATVMPKDYHLVTEFLKEYVSKFPSYTSEPDILLTDNPDILHKFMKYYKVKPYSEKSGWYLVVGDLDEERFASFRQSQRRGK